MRGFAQIVTFSSQSYFSGYHSATLSLPASCPIPIPHSTAGRANSSSRRHIKHSTILSRSQTFIENPTLSEHLTSIQSTHVAMAMKLLSSSEPLHVSQTCEEYGLTSTQFETLHSRCRDAKARAYCPYSRFRVGASLLTHDDQYIDGANVENASYPVGTCAERVALGAAVTQGHTKFMAVAVATDISPPASPCGMCRQLLVLHCARDRAKKRS